MTPAATEKRLEKIEIQLTPKEWAIRLADEQRQYPSSVECLRAAGKKTRQEYLVYRGFDALKKQADERHPGNNPSDIQLRSHTYKALRKEYHTLRMIVKVVGLAVAHQMEPLSLRIALRLSQLHALILRDLHQQHSPGAASLAAVLEDWVDDARTLVTDVLTIPAAVQFIEHQYFDGHQILFRDWEAQLNRTVKVVEVGISTFNDYLKLTSGISNELKEALVINIEVIKNAAKGKGGADLAARWLKEARDEANNDFLEAACGEWYVFQNVIRDFFGQNP
ncbi:MAG TPA: hypothetical protein VL486_00930 [Verrucomicrobiae bacterium]|nr:hypothetical protein [Verrucomicrobiae bacterium]